MTCVSFSKVFAAIVEDRSVLLDGSCVYCASCRRKYGYLIARLKLFRDRERAVRRHMLVYTIYLCVIALSFALIHLFSGKKCLEVLLLF